MYIWINKSPAVQEELVVFIAFAETDTPDRAYFAWKAFAQWKERQESTEEEKQKKAGMYQFLKNFRETFSRPVRRIRFMGLFDTGMKSCRQHVRMVFDRFGRV